MASVLVRVETDHTDPCTLSTIFTHEAVRVRAVGDVLGHQGDGDSHLLDMLDGTIDLWKVWRGRKGG